MDCFVCRGPAKVADDVEYIGWKITCPECEEYGLHSVPGAAMPDKRPGGFISTKKLVHALGEQSRRGGAIERTGKRDGVNVWKLR